MLDADLDARAAAQHGVITRTQTCALGATSVAIRHRLATGWWTRVTRDVFRIAGAPVTGAQRVLCAVLARGVDARTSHDTAAALHALPGFALEPVHVTVPRDRSPRGACGWAVVHRPRLLPQHHSRVVGVIPVTTVARTIFDLCGSVHPGRAERALDACLARRLVTVPALWSMLDELAGHGRAGSVALRSLLTARGEGYVAPASALERRFLEMVRDWALPPPDREVDLGDADGWVGRVEFVYREARLLVELDGRAFHTARLDREHDRARDNRFHAVGFRVLRFTWDDVTRHPGEGARLVRVALRAAA